jgi:hypothetical protein
MVQKESRFQLSAKAGHHFYDIFLAYLPGFLLKALLFSSGQLI